NRDHRWVLAEIGDDPHGRTWLHADRYFDRATEGRAGKGDDMGAWAEGEAAQWGVAGRCSVHAHRGPRHGVDRESPGPWGGSRAIASGMGGLGSGTPRVGRRRGRGCRRLFAGTVRGGIAGGGFGRAWRSHRSWAVLHPDLPHGGLHGGEVGGARGTCVERSGGGG